MTNTMRKVKCCVFCGSINVRKIHRSHNADLNGKYTCDKCKGSSTQTSYRSVRSRQNAGIPALKKIINAKKVRRECEACSK